MKLGRLAEDLRDNNRTLAAVFKLPDWKGRRNFPPHARKPISDYAKLVGEIAWASNHLHDMLSAIFMRLVDPHAMLVGFGIWNSIKADSAQRDMLKAAVEESAKLKLISVGSQIKWLCDATGRVSAYRNDAVHTPMRVILTEDGRWIAKPVFTAPASRIERMAAQRYMPLFKLLRGDLIELGGYASALYDCVAMDQYGRKRPRLPKRPRLLSHAFLTRELAPKPRHKARKKAQKRQRPASPP